MTTLTPMMPHPHPDSPIDRYARAARRAGVAPDQLALFVRGGYVAQPHQLAWHAAFRAADAADGPEQIAVGGRRGPGKTHAVFAQIALDDCQRMPGLKMLFLRKVLKAARESFEDVRRKILYATPHQYRAQAGVVVFPNGSRIVLGHFAHEDDIDQYLGIEYDGVAIEEVTQLSKTKLTMLRGSIRSTMPDWRPRLYLTTNPGGIGHAYFRETFVLPWRFGTETVTRFLPAHADQNRYLDTGYRAWLAGLDGVLGKMWRDGDWDAAGGQFFTNWQYDRIACPPLTTIPDHWRVWLAMDYGFQHYTVIYLVAQESDGRIIFVDEHAARRWLIPRHAEAVTAMLAHYGLTPSRLSACVAGGDLFGTESSGHSPATTWRDAGYQWTAATNDRIAGAAEWLRRLGDPHRHQTPTVAITTRCPRLLATMPLLLSDPKRPEDVLKIDTDADGEGGDDAYDAARYGLMVRPITVRRAPSSYSYYGG
ncbi:MAG: hypothetical protein IPM06_17480 [Rhizobiales bacterium]|nr:hypothetical protein [Hyphomicrobiales bacterium]